VDGQVYWVLLTNSVVRNAGGSPEYFVTMVEDIDERKQALEELHRSQARFQAIFNDSAVGSWDWTAGSAPIRITREEMIGMSAASHTRKIIRNLRNYWMNWSRDSAIRMKSTAATGGGLLGACDHVVGARAERQTALPGRHGH
jgi:PAS domain-containing protein